MKKAIHELISNDYEYIGEEVNPSTGNETMLFRGYGRKVYTIEVREED